MFFQESQRLMMLSYLNWDIQETALVLSPPKPTTDRVVYYLYEYGGTVDVEEITDFFKKNKKITTLKFNALHFEQAELTKLAQFLTQDSQLTTLLLNNDVTMYGRKNDVQKTDNCLIRINRFMLLEQHESFPSGDKFHQTTAVLTKCGSVERNEWRREEINISTYQNDATYIHDDRRCPQIRQIFNDKKTKIIDRSFDEPLFQSLMMLCDDKVPKYIRGSYHQYRGSIGNFGARVIAAELTKNITLKQLELNYQNILPQGIEDLANALQQNKTLTSLSLIGNFVGLRGAQALAQWLKINDSLANHLDLTHCLIDDAAVKILADSLAENKTLQQLCLSNNEIADVGAEALAGMLKHNSVLHTLILAKNKISKDGAKALAEALSANNSLKKIDLKDNLIDCQGMTDLLKAMTKNQAVETFTASFHSVTNINYQDTVNALLELISHNQTVASLQLDGFTFTDSQSLYLLNELEKNHTLTNFSFVLSNDIFNEQAKEIIARNINIKKMLVRINKLDQEQLLSKEQSQEVQKIYELFTQEYLLFWENYKDSGQLRNQLENLKEQMEKSNAIQEMIEKMTKLDKEDIFSKEQSAEAKNIHEFFVTQYWYFLLHYKDNGMLKNQVESLKKKIDQSDLIRKNIARVDELVQEKTLSQEQNQEVQKIHALFTGVCQLFEKIKKQNPLLEKKLDLLLNKVKENNLYYALQCAVKNCLQDDNHDKWDENLFAKIFASSDLNVDKFFETFAPILDEFKKEKSANEKFDILFQSLLTTLYTPCQQNKEKMKSVINKLQEKAKDFNNIEILSILREFYRNLWSMLDGINNSYKEICLNNMLETSTIVEQKSIEKDALFITSFLRRGFKNSGVEKFSATATKAIDYVNSHHQDIITANKEELLVKWYKEVAQWYYSQKKAGSAIRYYVKTLLLTPTDEEVIENLVYLNTLTDSTLKVWEVWAEYSISLKSVDSEKLLKLLEAFVGQYNASSVLGPISVVRIKELLTILHERHLTVELSKQVTPILINMTKKKLPIIDDLLALLPLDNLTDSYLQQAETILQKQSKEDNTFVLMQWGLVFNTLQALYRDDKGRYTFPRYSKNYDQTKNAIALIITALDNADINEKEKILLKKQELIEFFCDVWSKNKDLKICYFFIEQAVQLADNNKNTITALVKKSNIKAAEDFLIEKFKLPVSSKDRVFDSEHHL